RKVAAYRPFVDETDPAVGRSDRARRPMDECKRNLRVRQATILQIVEHPVPGRRYPEEVGDHAGLATIRRAEAPVRDPVPEPRIVQVARGDVEADESELD